MDVIDWAALKENCAGDEGLVTEIVELFHKEAPALLADVEAAVASREAGAIKRTAHRLKGALVSLAAPGATELARQLEAAGADGQLERVGEVQRALSTELARLLVVLETRGSGATPRTGAR